MTDSGGEPARTRSFMERLGLVVPDPKSETSPKGWFATVSWLRGRVSELEKRVEVLEAQAEGRAEGTR
jgi:hypothetical protein